MKICHICHKEIKIGQSWRNSGTSYAHIFCLIPKKIEITRIKRTRKNNDGQ